MLWPFNKYPGTDYETYNWEWIINTVKNYTNKIDNFINEGIFDVVLKIFEDHPGIIAHLLNQVDYVTPDMFGAVGDGTTDDSEAIQRAMDTGMPLHGTEGKTYYSASNLYAKNDIFNIHLIMDTSKMIIYEDAENVSVKNSQFEMKGIVLDPNDRGEYALAFTFCKNIWISDCYFKHFTNNVILNVTSDIYINNNYFLDSYQNATRGNGYGVVLQCCKRVSISDNHFKDVQRHGVYVSYTDEYENDDRFSGYNRWCDDVTISNNIFQISVYNDGVNRSSTEQQVKCFASKNVNIENNQFIGCYGALFISTEETDINGYCENITFNNNIVKNMVSDYRAIILELWQGATSPINKNITITGNTFQNVSRYPCVKLSKIHGLTVSNNTAVEDATNTAGYDYLVMLTHEGTGADDTMDCYKDIKITGNNVVNRGLFKIYTDDPTHSAGKIENVDISDNKVEFTGYIIMAYAENSSLEGFRLVNNVLKNAGTSIYLNAPTGFTGDDIVITGNDLSGYSVVFGSSFAGKITYLRNINDNISPSNLPSTSVNDLDEMDVLTFNTLNINMAGLSVGNHDLAVTFPKTLRTAPYAVMFMLYDSTATPTYLGCPTVKAGTLSTTGFTAVIPVKATSNATWSCRYVVIGRE